MVVAGVYEEDMMQSRLTANIVIAFVSWLQDGLSSLLLTREHRNCFGLLNQQTTKRCGMLLVEQAATQCIEHGQ
jgi:hypothetical protein